MPLSIVSVLLAAVWAIGEILRDRNWWMGLMFYFPTPVLVAWLLFAIVICRTRRRLHFILLIAPLLMLLGVENQWIRPNRTSTIAMKSKSDESAASTDSGSLTAALSDATIPQRKGGPYPKRLIHWNVGRGAMGWKKQWRHIEHLNPDIIVISEIPEPFEPATMTGFDVLTVHGMAVACHGSMTTSRTLVRGGALNAYHVTCQLSEGPFELMVADMTSHVTVQRDLYLRPFVTLLAERKIDVSVGDFNAPRRSLAFCDLPAGFQHSYIEAGAGWSYTWPVPVPCLAIDQCINGPRARPIRYELQSTLLSDHRLQILDFEWQPED